MQFQSPNAAVRRAFPHAQERRTPKAHRQTFAVRDATCPHNVRHALKVSAAGRSAHHARARAVQREAKSPLGRAAAAWVARMRRARALPVRADEEGEARTQLCGQHLRRITAPVCGWGRPCG